MKGRVAMSEITPQPLPNKERPHREVGHAHAAHQPFEYPLKREYVEPDWTRIPAYKDVTMQEWHTAQWQRAHTVKNLKQLKETLGDLISDTDLNDIEKDQHERSTMAMLVPPQMLNTMAFGDGFKTDPVRRYMIPMFSERETEWTSHPMASRDSLHEADMWAVEGLTHRYPTKVLAELLPTCPQYCGHCTRMDLVGTDTEQVLKYKFEMKQNERWDAMLEYLRTTPQVRDVVVSGGDVANLPIARLESFVMSLLDIENIRDIRLATKGLMGIPQHFLQDEVKAGFERMGARADERGAQIAVHTHVNAAQQVTPLVGDAVQMVLDAGFRDVRNQGVLLRGVNTTPNELLELCFMLLDHAKVMPYYFYICDMIPNAEHWRTSVKEVQDLQYAIMGYLPGFATPRMVVDVPFVGKRWAHMLSDYDHAKGISYWTKNYRTGIEDDDPDALTRRYPYYDPIYTLPEEGQAYWREIVSQGRLGELELTPA
ncbi:MAG: lysine 2,3-aminomutase [Actinomycetota bacterium]